MRMPPTIHLGSHSATLGHWQILGIITRYTILTSLPTTMMLSNRLVAATVLAVASGLTAAGTLGESSALKRDDPTTVHGVEQQIKADNPSNKTDIHGVEWEITAERPDDALNNALLHIRRFPENPDNWILVSDDNMGSNFDTNSHDGEWHLGSNNTPCASDEGPTAYLNLTKPGSDDIDRYEIGFANVTSSFYASSANGTVDKGWIISLLDPENDVFGRKLNHTFDADLVGFSLCPGGIHAHGAVWYYVYLLVGSKDQSWDNNGCVNNVTVWTWGEGVCP
ncbi:hypothetical protein F5Y05DRAFT_421170 [Hypoxylon sp. FL0543]|nr:hypothetical protein F5Y05DRAFT_421170 [Hypoxylon sp. FL0543]